MWRRWAGALLAWLLTCSGALAGLAPTSASAAAPVEVGLSSLTAAATGVTWTVAFPVFGYGTVDVTDTAGARFPVTAGSYTVTLPAGDVVPAGCMPLVGAVEPIAGGVAVQLIAETAGCSISVQSTAPEALAIAGVTNPTSASADAVTVSAAGDFTGTSSSFVLAPAPSLAAASGASLAASSDVAGATGVTWAVSIGASLVNAALVSNFQLQDLGNLNNVNAKTFPTSQSDYTITQTGGCTFTITGLIADPQEPDVAVTPDCTGATNTLAPIRITVQDVTNPTAGADQIGFTANYTSGGSESFSTGGVLFIDPAQLSGVTAAASSDVEGNPAIWTVDLTTGGQQTSPISGTTLAVTDQDAAGFTATASNYTLTVAGVTYAATSATGGNGLVSLSFAAGVLPLPPATEAVLTMAGVRNPSAAGAARAADYVTVSMPGYTPAASPQFGFMPATALTDVTASMQTLAPQAAGSWTVGFVAGNGAIGGTGTITLGDTGDYLTFPSLATDYAIVVNGGQPIVPVAAAPGVGSVELTLPASAAVPGGASVALTAANVLNPAAFPAGATDSITVATSASPGPVASPPFRLTLTGVSAAVSSTVAGAVGATWTVAFTNSAAALGPGDTLTLHDQLGAGFSSATATWAITAGGGAAFAPASVTAGSGQAVLTLGPGQSIAAGAAVSIQARATTNPSTASATDAVSVSTSRSGPATSATFFFGAQGGVFSFAPTFTATPTVAQAPATWTVSFTTLQALAAGTDTITVQGPGYPGSPVFPSAGADYTLADTTAGGAAIAVTAAPAVSVVSDSALGTWASVATITVPMAVAAHDNLVLTVAQAVNPLATSYPAALFTVASSQSPAPVAATQGMTFVQQAAPTTSTTGLPPLVAATPVVAGTTQAFAATAAGEGPCSADGSTFASNPNPNADGNPPNPGIGGGGTGVTVSNCQLTKPSPAAGSYIAPSPNVTLPVSCSFTLDPALTGTHTNTMWIFQDELSNASSGSVPGVGYDDGSLGPADYAGETATGSELYQKGSTAGLESVSDSNGVPVAQNFYDGNFLHCAFQLMQVPAGGGQPVPAGPVTQVSTPPGQTAATTASVTASLTSLTGTYELAYDVWAGQTNAQGAVIDGPLGCAWTENDEETQYTLLSQNVGLSSQNGGYQYSQWTFDQWQQQSGKNLGGIGLSVPGDSGCATNPAPFASPSPAGNPSANAGAYNGSVISTSASGAQRLVGDSAQFTLSVAPTGLLQLNVAPYKIVYQPVGDQSQASFTLTQGATSSTEVSFGQSQANVSAADTSTSGSTSTTQNTGNIGAEMVGYVNQSQTTKDSAWDTATTTTTATGTSATNSEAWTDTFTQSWSTTPNANVMDNPSVPPWYYDIFALSVHPQIGVWDMSATASGGTPASVGTKPGGPQISSVAFSGSPPNLTITVTGTGFGTGPLAGTGGGALPLPCGSGCDSADFAFADGTGGWDAGIGTAGVTLKYQSWSNTQIVITGFGSVYGNTFQVFPGDAVGITVTNPQTGVSGSWSGAFTTGSQAQLQYALLNTDSAEVDVTAKQLLDCSHGAPLPLPGSFTPPVTLQPSDCASLLSLDPFAATGSQAVDPAAEIGSLATAIKSVSDVSPGLAVQYNLTSGETLSQSTQQTTAFASSITDVEASQQVVDNTTSFNNQPLASLGSLLPATVGPAALRLAGLLTKVGFGVVGAALGATSSPTSTSTTTASSDTYTLQVGYQQSQTTQDTSTVIGAASAKLLDGSNPLEATVWLDSRWDTLMFQVPAPTVSAVSPAGGTTAGGATITVDGTGFWSGPVQVEFCTVGSASCTPATSTQALSNTEITATTPPLGSGTVDVRVQGVGGLSAAVAADQFTFATAAASGAPASVTGVSPTTGPDGGGTTVTLTGSGFGPATQVWFGSLDGSQDPSVYAAHQQAGTASPYAPAATFQIVSDQQIVACAPAVSGPETVYVSVYTQNGWSSNGAASQFSYTAGAAAGPCASATQRTSSGPPVVTSVSPGIGPGAGGTVVTVVASGLQAGQTVVPCDGQVCPLGQTPTLFTPPPVQFCPTSGGSCAEATDVQLIDGGRALRAVAPPGQGTAFVEVGGPNGFSVAGNVTEFSYLPPVPGITAPQGLGPASISAGGDPQVTAAGLGRAGLIATVLNTQDAPVSGAYVQFATSLGQVSVSQAVYSNALGVATATLTSPVPGTATVYALVYGSPTLQSGAVVLRFEPVPVVTDLSAATGSAGDTLTVAGRGFTGASAVYFGTVPATSFAVAGDGSLSAVVPPGAGTVDVHVANVAAESGSTPADAFTYPSSTGTGTGPSSPVITSLSPAFGPVQGENAVVIGGSGFGGATSVAFGGAAAAFVIDTSTQITATAPGGAPGAARVTVTGPGGTASASYTYLPSPTVTGLSPASGAQAGGTPVAIGGTGFSAGSSVDFGGNPAGSVTFVSASELTATAPAGSGTVDVTVTTPCAAGSPACGTSAAVLAGRYSYLPPPDVTAISPAFGPTAGGTQVIISGSGFTGATAVRFGALSAAYTVDSDGTIAATAPAGAPGTVDVTVTGPNGTSGASPADRFTFGTPPSVAGLSPDAGAAAGGGTVTITGTGFTTATAVSFGASPATFAVADDSHLTARVPAGAGTVDVTVTAACGTAATAAATSCGTSPVSPSDRYTYLPLPSVASLFPSSGPTAGGTAVTIAGAGFTTASAVDFGATAASFTVVSDSEIRATAPAGSGTVAVTVTASCAAATATSCGTGVTTAADEYTYVSPAQTVVRTLNPGWNTLSVPFALAYATLGATFSDGGASILAAYTFTDGNWQPALTRTFFHQPQRSVTLPSPMTGLLIYIGGSAQVTVTLTPAAAAATATTPSSPPGTYALTQGWNLVGPASGNLSEPVSVFLKGANIPEFDDPNTTALPVADPGMDTLDQVRDGYAYWVYAGDNNQVLASQIAPAP